MPDKIMLDTNVLLNYHSKALEQYEKVYIPITVLEELDKLKMSDSDEKRFQARQAIRALECAENVEYVQDECLDMGKADNRILKIAKESGCKLVTQDINMRIKADALRLNVGKFEDESICEEYKGYKEIRLSEYEQAVFYECQNNKWGLLLNEYLVIKDECGKTIDRLKWTSKGFQQLKMPNIKGFKPLNDLQYCAFDLMASDTPIKILLGKAGTGKTLINLRAGLNHLEKGKFERIVYVRNPIGKGKNVGYLPGSKEEKLEPFSQAITDNLENGEMQFKQLMNTERLQFECPYFMKGASKENSWFLVDEAEDLDVDTIKLIGTRLAANSVICFSGDLHQAEKEYRHNNGLVAFIEKYKGNPMVGIVKLKEDVRSDVSRLFGEL